MNNNDRWSALSMKDRAALIDIYVKSGITDLGEIRKDYNSFGDGGDTAWEKVDRFVDTAEPWTSGASLALAGATAAIPAIAPVSVPAMAAANYAGVLMDGYQAVRDFQDKNYKSGVWNSVEALTGMFGAKAASKLAHTAGGRAIGKFKEQLVESRFNSSGDKIARLMRKGLTYEKAAERVMQNAVNYVDNSSKVKDVTEGIKKSYSEKFNKGTEIADSIFDATDVVESVFSRFKEEHPVEIYKCGGKLNKFETGGDTNNTLLSREEYLNNKRQEIIDASLNNSRNRTEPASPLIPMFDSEEEWRDITTKELETINSKLSDSKFWFDNPSLLYQKKDLSNRKKILEEELSKPYTTKYYKGASCIYTATDNYGKKYRAASNYQMHQNPEKYGFIRIDPNSAKPGDILQIGLDHAITYDHMGDDGYIIYNQSGGGDTKESIGVGRRSANKGFGNFSNAYRFIGLQEDNDKWNSEYNKYRQNYSKNIIEELKNVPIIELPKTVNTLKTGGPTGEGTATYNHPRYNHNEEAAIYSYLRERGVPHIQTSAIMGNIAVESMLDPNISQIGGGGGYGLIQATDQPRKNNFINYDGQPYEFGSKLDPETQRQLDYIIDKGLNNYTVGEWRKVGKSGARNVRKEFLKESDIIKASDLFTKGYLRPGKPHTKRRQSMSTFYNEKYTNPFENEYNSAFLFK